MYAVKSEKLPHDINIFHFSPGSFHEASDVTIIEMKIKIDFFFENRIESKSIFWLVFFSILTHGYIGEDNTLLRVQSMTVELWCAEYADLITRIAFRSIPPTPVSMTQSLLSPSYV